MADSEDCHFGRCTHGRIVGGQGWDSDWTTGGALWILATPDRARTSRRHGALPLTMPNRKTARARLGLPGAVPGHCACSRQAQRRGFHYGSSVTRREQKRVALVSYSPYSCNIFASLYTIVV